MWYPHKVVGKKYVEIFKTVDAFPELSLNDLKTDWGILFIFLQNNIFI